MTSRDRRKFNQMDYTTYMKQGVKDRTFTGSY